MRCDCIKESRALLKEGGLEVVMEDGIRFDGTSKATLFYAFSTKKKNGHRGPPLIFDFCPFCGEKL